MNSLKRIFVSIKSQIDHVADEFENHEALASAAISDLQNLQQTTRLHLHRVSKMSDQYQQKINKEQENIHLWSERALKIRSQDEEKALQCIKRMRDAQRQVDLLTQQHTQSCAQEKKIRSDLDTIQQQLQQLKNKKEILSARQNRNAVQDLIQDNHGNALQDVQSIFDRWEGSVVSNENDTFTPEDNDSFAQAFEQEEDELELKMMLDELSAKQDPSSDQ